MWAFHEGPVCGVDGRHYRLGGLRKGRQHHTWSVGDFFAGGPQDPQLVGCITAMWQHKRRGACVEYAAYVRARDLPAACARRPYWGEAAVLRVDTDARECDALDSLLGEPLTVEALELFRKRAEWPPQALYDVGDAVAATLDRVVAAPGPVRSTPHQRVVHKNATNDAEALRSLADGEQDDVFINDDDDDGGGGEERASAVVRCEPQRGTSRKAVPVLRRVVPSPAVGTDDVELFMGSDEERDKDEPSSPKRARSNDAASPPGYAPWHCVRIGLT